MTTLKVARGAGAACFSSEGAGGFIAVPPEQATYSSEDYERESIARAKEGDAEAGHECLSRIMHAIDAQRFDSPLFPYLADCIHQYLLGSPIEEAFNVVPPEDRGGRPATHDSTEIAAVDILLRDHAGMNPEAAIQWMQEHIIDLNIDRRLVQKIRKKFDSRYNAEAACPLTESLSKALLLNLSGNLYKHVSNLRDPDPEEANSAPPGGGLPLAFQSTEGDDLTFKLRRQFYRQGADADTDLIIDAVRSIVPEDMSDAALRKRISDARAFVRDHRGSRAEYLRNR